MNQLIPTSLLGIFMAGEKFKVQNARTGQMQPEAYDTVPEAINALRVLDNSTDAFSPGEADIVRFLNAEVSAWDEVIKKVTVTV